MKKSLQKLIQNNDKMPLFAVLRGITPDEAIPVAEALIESGFTLLEITLNSPQPFESIKLIADEYGDKITLGAGTVVNSDQVAKVKQAGGEFIVSPNLNLDVLSETIKNEMVSIPGCYTPSEAFQAIDGGADIVKIFPAETLGVKYIKSIKAVLPKGTMICPTGGVTVDNIYQWIESGVTSMGMGSALYKPGKSIDDITKSASEFVNAVKNTK